MKLISALPYPPAILVPLAAIHLLLCAGCMRKAGAPPAMTPTVTAAHPLLREVTDWDEYTGHLQSPQSASVQARITGLVTQTPFKEGALVHEGDVLFVIDDAPFKADLDNKRATVAKDAAQLVFTKTQMDRTTKLLQTHVEAPQDYDTAQANYQQAQAQLAADKAAEEVSALNLEWTKVRAPISGRVSKINVTVGNLVTGGVGNGTTLTTLVSVDPMYCYVPVPERNLLKYQAYARSQRETARSADIACAIELENETNFPHTGVIDFIDNSVDPGTGTIQVRGVFKNADAFLTPGLFARMRIDGSGPHKALLIPDASVGTDQSERYVLLAEADGTIRSQPVELGRVFGSLRVIEKGVSPSDRVLINGLQMARPGSKATVEEGRIPEPSAESIGATASGGGATAPARGGSPGADAPTQPAGAAQTGGAK